MGLHMTAVITRRDNGTFDCGGAQVRAYGRHLATVVTVRGEIDVVNVDRVKAYVRRLALEADQVVLDLSEMDNFAPVGIGLLCMLDDEWRAAGVEWMLVAGPAVVEALGDEARAMFPITRSVHEALHNVAEAIGRRRQMVLSLIGKTA
ncbi:sulfate transporter [Mycobacterium sp. 852002-51163_SCH5372311]|nr:sulfate transporter [Mycobacterium sp. 852002-51163_SCH5372311]